MDDPRSYSPLHEWFLRPDGVDGSRGIHGVAHAARVGVHALAVAGELKMPTWEIEAVRFAAMWHDIGRMCDGVDYYHGAKSAGKVIGLGLHLAVDPIILDAALFAVTHHCGSEEHALRAARNSCEPDAYVRVLYVLQDGDALDRARLGDLDEDYLHYAPSCLRVERAYELLDEVT